MTGVVEVADIADALKDHGLEPRGGFNFLASDDAPPAASGKHAASALLVGQVGAANWPYFQAWSDGKSPPPENPLDTWSREIIEKVAADFAARAVFPSDKPYLPFQTWAMRAERLRPSPLGILIHPEYGLWHAYRGALLFDEFIPSPSPPDPGFPCDDCTGKPCLSACPAGAISPSRYDVPACVGHVAGPGGEDCKTAGCLARNACPAGARYRYADDVQAFHMRAFLADNQPGWIVPFVRRKGVEGDNA